MAGGVGVNIKNNKIMLRSMHNKILFVFRRITLNITKNASRGGAIVSDVLVAPGTPQPVQISTSGFRECYRIGGWRVSSWLPGSEGSGDPSERGTSSLMSSFSSLPGLK